MLKLRENDGRKCIEYWIMPDSFWWFCVAFETVLLNNNRIKLCAKQSELTQKCKNKWNIFMCTIRKWLSERRIYDGSWHKQFFFLATNTSTFKIDFHVKSRWFDAKNACPTGVILIQRALIRKSIDLLSKKKLWYYSLFRIREYRL